MESGGTEKKYEWYSIATVLLVDLWAIFLMSMEVSISFYIIFLDVCLCVFTWTLPSGNLTHLLKITCFNMQNIKVNGPFSSIAREFRIAREGVSPTTPIGA